MHATLYGNTLCLGTIMAKEGSFIIDSIYADPKVDFAGTFEEVEHFITQR